MYYITLSRHVASTWNDEATSALHQAQINNEEARCARDAGGLHDARIRLEMIKHHARTAVNGFPRTRGDRPRPITTTPRRRQVPPHTRG